MIKIPGIDEETNFFSAEVFPYKFSSALDIPREHLPLDVWHTNSRKEEVLNEDIRDEIIKRSSSFLQEQFKENYTFFVYGLYIISSIGTVFYSDTSDIDVKIVIDFDILFKIKPDLKKYHKSDIIDYLLAEIRSKPNYLKPAKGSERPYDWFFFDKDDFEGLVEKNTKRFDSIYDILNKKWLKRSPIPKDLKEDGILNYALEKTKDILLNFDVEFGKLNRNTLDYLYFMDYLKHVNPDSKIVQSKVESLSHDIEELLASLETEREYYGKLRWDASSKELLEGTYAKLFKSFNFTDANLIRKILDRYGYWMILMELKGIKEGNPKSPIPSKTVEEIRQVLHNG